MKKKFCVFYILFSTILFSQAYLHGMGDVDTLDEQISNSLAAEKAMKHPNNINTKFLTAIYRNNENTIQAILTTQPTDFDINYFNKLYPGSFSQTPLTLAVELGHTTIVETLLEYGANPNLVDGMTNRPLFIAITNGSREIVNILLRHEANPNLLDDLGYSPLFFALRWGAQMVELLIRYGAHPTQELTIFDDRYERSFTTTALFEAITYCNPEIIEIMLNAVDPYFSHEAYLAIQEAYHHARRLMNQELTKTQQTELKKIIQLLSDKLTQVEAEQTDPSLVA